MINSKHIIKNYYRLKWQKKLGGIIAILIIIHSLTYLVHIKDESHISSELSKQNAILAQEIKNLKNKLAQETNLTSTLIDIEQKNADKNAMLFNEDHNALLDFITNIAQHAGMKINSIKPLIVIDNKIYHTAPVLIVADATFQAILVFLESLSKQLIATSIPQITIATSKQNSQTLNVSMTLYINTKVN